MAESKKPVSDKKGAETKAWIDSGTLWGVLLLLLGLLFLLSNLGVTSIHWGEIWKLWPVAIVVAGLSVLPLQGKVSNLVYGLAAVAVAVLVWTTLTGAFVDTSRSVKSESFSISKPEESAAEAASISVAAGGAALNISSSEDVPVVEGVSRGDRIRLSTSTKVSDGLVDVKLEQSYSRGWMPGQFGEMDIRLTEGMPVDLEIDAGATSIKADLSDVMLRSLLVDSGASSIDLKLGDKLDQSEVNIDTGASSVSIRVPKSLGVRLVLDTGLSSKNLPEGYKKIDDETYQSPNYDSSDRKLTLNVDMGLSSFKLSTY